ncbi:MAG: NAD(+)/NADH kinase [Acidobacteriia bacterium]|nr:NAD(+)/NADH kinase [Terriglobia bacterium]
MTYQNAHLIYNPNAGGLQGRKAKLVEESARILRGSGHRLELCRTASAGHATELARAAVAAGADLILVAGGDGTINEAMNGMVGSSVPLGVLPGGTASVLAMEIGLGKNMRRAAAHLGELVPARIAVGLLEAPPLERRHFLLMAGAGLDAAVVCNIRADVKRRLGKGAYWLAGLSMVGKSLPQLEVRANGATVRTGFALVSRVRNYGGDLSIARTACLLEDRFEVVTFAGESSLPYLKYMTGVVLGLLPGMKGVRIQQADRVELDAPAGRRLAIQLDGEYAGHLPVTLTIVPDALTLLVPAKFLASR